MSKQQKTPSSVERGEQNTDSLYDFLYYDDQRVGSLLSQMSNFGHLTGITKDESASRSRDNSGVLNVTGGVPLVASGSAKGTTSNQLSHEETSSRTYDPLWANALQFLDAADEKQLINRDLPTARMGQVVLIQGSLAISDLGILEQLWERPAIKQMIRAGAENEEDAENAGLNRQQRKAAAKRRQPKGRPELTEAEIGIEMIAALPHSIQAAVTCNDESVWCTLVRDKLTVSAVDLFYKHGFAIGDDWALLGVLDAVPDEIEDAELHNGLTTNGIKQVGAGTSLSQMSVLFTATFVEPVKALLGKPNNSYAVTPLLIFRSVS